MEHNGLSQFLEEDVDELSRRGIMLEEALRQYNLLRDPSPKVQVLDRPAKVGDGIRVIDGRALPELVAKADEVRLDGRVSKFVPASGAATRMFQSLSSAVEAFVEGTISESQRADVDRFFSNIEKFPFFGELESGGVVTPGRIPASDDERIAVLARIIGSPLDYASRPKGLIQFHRYGSEARTPFEEHFVEASEYAADSKGNCRLHFSVPVDSKAEFERVFLRRWALLESMSPATFEATFSVQRESTATISITMDKALLRDADGKLLFRPGGHGALLQNLQDFGGDIVVVKNIDNVVPESRMPEVAFWKKVLIGYLATLQETAFRYVHEIHEDDCEGEFLDQALDFVASQLLIFGAREMRKAEEKVKKAFLLRILDRPIRVCGMVRNDGEPGGGPFWTRGADGSVSMQIVESAEFDSSNPEQKDIWSQSTHFNPVDLVLGVRNCEGEPYSLDLFADHKAVFRARKSVGGRDIIVLERPGLWNGSMAYWNTVFVEVPAKTFAPVKTVFDLLRPEHQTGNGER